MNFIQSAKVKKSYNNPLIKPSMVPFAPTLTYKAGITQVSRQVRHVDYGYSQEEMRRLKCPFPIYGRGAPEAFGMWIKERLA